MLIQGPIITVAASPRKYSPPLGSFQQGHSTKVLSLTSCWKPHFRSPQAEQLRQHVCKIDSSKTYMPSKITTASKNPESPKTNSAEAARSSAMATSAQVWAERERDSDSCRGFGVWVSRVACSACSWLRLADRMTDKYRSNCPADRH